MQRNTHGKDLLYEVGDGIGVGYGPLPRLVVEQGQPYQVFALAGAGGHFSRSLRKTIRINISKLLNASSPKIYSVLVMEPKSMKEAFVSPSNTTHVPGDHNGLRGRTTRT